MDITTQLQSHPLFSSLAPDALAEAVRAATVAKYQAGDVCIRRGAPGEVFGILINGRLEAIHGRGSRDETRLGAIEPGECFGEMSLLTGDASEAEVVARVDSEAIVFLQEAIGPIVANDRNAIQYLAKLVTRRLAKPAETTAPLQPTPSVPRFSLGAHSPMRILSVSCRQHQVRYSFFDTTSEEPLAWGEIHGVDGEKPTHVFSGPRGEATTTVEASGFWPAMAAMLAAITDPEKGALESPLDLSAIGHRVIHGGPNFSSPVLVDAKVKEEVKRLSSLAPLDNPYNLAGIEACEVLVPGVPQVAVFDTAFHAGMPPAARTFALPSDLANDPDLHRYGFHGISNEGAARSAARFLGSSSSALRMVICHLGTGASICAVDHGRSIETTMGYSTLSGLPMATRSGDVDPGLLLYLVETRGMSPDKLRQTLATKSGMLGLSGISGDMLEVLQAGDRGDPRALLALQVFCQRARKNLGGCLALLGGADVIVFTGGVACNAPGIRARICQGFEWMGILLSEAVNRTVSVGPGEVADISEPHSRVRIVVAGSEEERTIAVNTVRALSQRRVTDVLRLKQRRIPVSVSAHHVHLTQEHVEALFGAGHELTWYADLSQPRQFACKEQVALIGPKGRIERVRVLGPVRPQTQVEISRTEEFKLGIDAPVRMSGDLDGTPGLTLEGTTGQIRLQQGVICAQRHIHMTPADAMEFALRDHDVVRIRIAGERSLIFGDVVVRVHPQYELDMHIDTDEANAAEVGPGAYGFLDSIQERASGTSGLR